MVDAGKEIGEGTDPRGRHEGQALDRPQHRLVAADSRFTAAAAFEDGHQGVAKGGELTNGEGQQPVETIGPAQEHRIDRVQHPGRRGGGQVKGVVADGHYNAELTGPVAGDAQGKVLQREVGVAVVGRLHPAGTARLVGVVDIKGTHSADLFTTSG